MAPGCSSNRFMLALTRWHSQAASQTFHSQRAQVTNLTLPVNCLMYRIKGLVSRAAERPRGNRTARPLVTGPAYFVPRSRVSECREPNLLATQSCRAAPLLLDPQVI